MTRQTPPMFRFTIRDVLWLTVVVALSVGWLIDHRRLDRVSSVWRIVATLLYEDVREATGESPTWEIMGKPWPPN
jgi:hypothetical protein